MHSVLKYIVMSVVYSTIFDEVVAFSVWFLHRVTCDIFIQNDRQIVVLDELSVLLCLRVINNLSCGVGFTHC